MAGYKIEERSRRHEVGRGDTPGGGLGRKVRLDEIRSKAIPALGDFQSVRDGVRRVSPSRDALERGREQGRIVIDQNPLLQGRQHRRHCAEVRAGTGAEIGDADAFTTGKTSGELFEDFRIARAMVHRLP